MSDIDGWTFDQGEFRNSAERRGERLELDTSTYDDETYLEVYLEAGSGYLQQNLDARINVDVLVKLMEHAGYKVTKS